jgi:hypothetical protein
MFWDVEIIAVMSSKHLWNVGQFLPGYVVQHPKDSHHHTHHCENLWSLSKKEAL